MAATLDLAVTVDSDIVTKIPILADQAMADVLASSSPVLAAVIQRMADRGGDAGGAVTRFSSFM